MRWKVQKLTSQLINPRNQKHIKSKKQEKVTINKLSYRRGTARRAVSVKTVLNVVQMFVKLQLKSCIMGLLQLRYEHDSSTIRLRFDYDSATTRYNTLRGFSCARIRDRMRESVVGVSCMLIDSSMHTAFTVYLYRPILHRVCEYARNCLYKGN